MVGGYTHTGKSSRGPLGRVIIGYDRKKGRLYRKEIRKEEEEWKKKNGPDDRGGLFRNGALSPGKLKLSTNS